MEEFLQNLSKNLIAPIHNMDEKEKEVQKALGLFKTYSGYVRAQGNTHFDVYEVQDVTMDGARVQLNKIVKKAQKKSKVLLELIFIVDEKEETHNGWSRSVWVRPLDP